MTVEELIRWLQDEMPLDALVAIPAKWEGYDDILEAVYDESVDRVVIF